MKNQKKQLLLLLSLGMSMQTITAMEAYEAPTKTYTPEQYQNATNTIHTKLLNDPIFLNSISSESFNPVIAQKEQYQQPQQYLTSSINAKHNDAVSENNNQSRSLSRNSSTDSIYTDNSSVHSNDGINISENDTPAAYLQRTLESSVNFKDTFDTLTESMNDAKKGSSAYNISQQARTLLVRAHPELVQGLSENLAILPNRFMSYFKENLPTFFTDAGKQRFVQSIVMETLKSMPSDNAITKFMQEKNLKFSPSQQNFALNSIFENQLTAVVAKYTNDLDELLKSNNLSTQATLMTQWSRNIITELALLAPRTVGAIVGGAIGTGVGAVGGAATGVIIGGAKGSDAGFSLGNKIGGKTGRAVGNIAGGATGAALGIAISAPAGAIGGGIGAAQLGAQAGEYLARSAANAVGQSARYVYDQGSQLFTPSSSRLTSENLANSVSSNNLVQGNTEESFNPTIPPLYGYVNSNSDSVLTMD